MAPGRVPDGQADNGVPALPFSMSPPVSVPSKPGCGGRCHSRRRGRRTPIRLRGTRTAMTWAMSPPSEVDDRYLLRDLAWCGPCGLSLEPALLSPDRRFYGCRNIHCPRPLVPAELLEALVWQAFWYLFGVFRVLRGCMTTLDHGSTARFPGARPCPKRRRFPCGAKPAGPPLRPQGRFASLARRPFGPPLTPEPPRSLWSGLRAGRWPAPAHAPQGNRRDQAASRPICLPTENPDEPEVQRRRRERYHSRPVRRARFRRLQRRCPGHRWRYPPGRPTPRRSTTTVRVMTPVCCSTERWRQRLPDRPVMHRRCRRGRTHRVWAPRWHRCVLAGRAGSPVSSRAGTAIPG